jgi:hypothetical protein
MPSISLAAKHAALDAHHAQVMRRIEAETVDQTIAFRGATAGGDTQRLRGIPAIGRGVGGAINGTRP